ncbi:zinc ribbon domain-containing protein [Nocardia vulneris]|uniref:Recombinase zinc beta ribbon domain-containing protein n=1 Tax=Nocardia vulneris TaxID=1141657 RepID=A0ABR4ZDA1_9NOCA|nr:zinc ribbon domain-containing protein [Nocardia vulneris]KIA63062.1 hypothetical protein FG87_22185 [Nocardia vulneris]
MGEIVAKAAGTPIVAEKDWDRLMALFASRQRGRPNSETYLCSGLVFCDLCGHHLSGRPKANLRPYPDGKMRRQYWCQKRAINGGCGKITIDQRELDKHIGAIVVGILADPRHAEAVEAASKAIEEARRPLMAERAECEQLALELSKRLGRRQITVARYDAAMDPLEQQIAELNAKLDEIGTVPDGPVSAEDAKASLDEWTARWKAATTTEKRGMFRQALTGKRVVIKTAVRNGRAHFDPGRIAIEDVKKKNRGKS